MKLFKSKTEDVKRVEADEVKAVLELEVRMGRVEELLHRLHPDQAPIISKYLRGEK
jgi:hypothetical protein